MNYKIYTDGSAIGCTPDYYGGWAAIIVERDVPIKILKGSGFPMTNNEAELTAIFHAIKYATDNPNDTFVIHSDSAYCLNAVQDWIYNWAVNGWINSKKEQIANIELFKQIYKLVKYKPLNIQYCKVKGHSGDFFNEMADDYATDMSEQERIKLSKRGDNYE